MWCDMTGRKRALLISGVLVAAVCIAAVCVHLWYESLKTAKRKGNKSGRALTLPYFYSSICLPKYIAAAWTSALCSFVANSLSSPESMITAPLTSPCESIGAAAIA